MMPEKTAAESFASIGLAPPISTIVTRYGYTEYPATAVGIL
jgi:hypothetical protein